jgi:transposase InsO family protein
MVGPAAKREAVAHLKAVMGLSERRACQIISADRKMVRYRSRRPSEAELRKKLRDLANERRRFGYRRLFVLLRREGEPSGRQPHLSAVSRGRAFGSQAESQAACRRHACADTGRSEGQCPLVAGFRP